MTEQLSHGVFILGSYGVTALVVGGLLCWLIFTGRQRRARIDVLAAQSNEPSDES